MRVVGKLAKQSINETNQNKLYLVVKSPSLQTDMNSSSSASAMEVWSGGEGDLYTASASTSICIVYRMRSYELTDPVKLAAGPECLCNTFVSIFK